MRSSTSGFKGHIFSGIVSYLGGILGIKLGHMCICLAINTSCYELTKFRPFEIMFSIQATSTD